MLYLFSLAFLSLIYQLRAGFKTEPDHLILGHTNSSGTSIVISPNETKIAVGFADGSLKIFDTELNQLCEFKSSNGSEIVQIIWLQQHGPVTLDTHNKVSLWSESCQKNTILKFNKTISVINWSLMDAGQRKIAIVTVSYDNKIVEYNAQTGNVFLEYSLPENQTSLDIIYNQEGEKNQKVTVLLVATNTSKIRKFQTVKGSQINAFTMDNPVFVMDTIEEIVIGMTLANHIIKMDSKGETLDRGEFAESFTLAIFSTNKQFILAHTTQSVGVYQYTGELQQNITSLSALVSDIDSSELYLVVVDQKGSVYVYTQEEFQSWIVAIIVGVLGGLVAVVIGVFVFIKLKAKWAEDAKNSKYAGKSTKYPKPSQRNKKSQASTESFNGSSLHMTTQE